MDIQGIGMLKSRMQETLYMSQNQESLNEESIKLANDLSVFPWPHFKVQEPCTMCCGRRECCCQGQQGSMERAREDDGLERVKELRKMRKKEEIELAAVKREEVIQRLATKLTKNESQKARIPHDCSSRILFGTGQFMSALEDQFERSLSESLKNFEKFFTHSSSMHDSKNRIDEAVDIFRQKREDKVELLERSAYSLVRVPAAQSVQKFAAKHNCQVQELLAINPSLQKRDELELDQYVRVPLPCNNRAQRVKIMEDRAVCIVYHYLERCGTVAEMTASPVVPGDLSFHRLDGSTICHLAAEFGNLEILEYLQLLEGKLVSKSCLNGSNIAHIAAAHGRWEVLEWIYKKSKFSFLLRLARNDGLLPVHCAAKSGHMKALKWFHSNVPGSISLKTSSNISQGGSLTTAYLAALGCHKNVCKWIWKIDSSLFTMQAADGSTALGLLSILDSIEQEENT
eukprot:756354-Hanusia_phi.AAC.1